MRIVPSNNGKLTGHVEKRSDDLSHWYQYLIKTLHADDSQHNPEMKHRNDARYTMGFNQALGRRNKPCSALGLGRFDDDR